jgi:hypothetical protein
MVRHALASFAPKFTTTLWFCANGFPGLTVSPPAPFFSLPSPPRASTARSPPTTRFRNSKPLIHFQLAIFVRFNSLPVPADPLSAPYAALLPNFKYKFPFYSTRTATRMCARGMSCRCAPSTSLYYRISVSISPFAQRGVAVSSCELQAGLWYAGRLRNPKPVLSVNPCVCCRYIAVADLFQQSPTPPPVQFHITVSMLVVGGGGGGGGGRGLLLL